MYGKLMIACELVTREGLHIGASSGFSAIGTVDSPVIKDPLTGYPIVPGSSLKGKLRTLLAQKMTDQRQRGDGRNAWNEDPPAIKRLFGSSDPIQTSRLQFTDCPVLNPQRLKPSEMTEIKTENSIARSGMRNEGRANPRQIERVIRGISFSVRIVYNAFEGIESSRTREDMELLVLAMRYLQRDYLGGHGTRGSGAVSFQNFQLSAFPEGADLSALEALFRPVAGEEPYAVETEN